MKKTWSILLGAALLLALAACGGGGGETGDGPARTAPDLNQFYEDFMSALGENDRPAMMDVGADLLPGVYPGLESIAARQLVAKTALISAVAFEFVLIEPEDPAGVQAAADVLQARIDYQTANGAFYPMTVEAWEQAKVITRGGVAALLCAGDLQADAEAAFNALFD